MNNIEYFRIRANLCLFLVGIVVNIVMFLSCEQTDHNSENEHKPINMQDN